MPAEQKRVEACPECGLHPYDFTVVEYREELDHKQKLLNEARAELQTAQEQVKVLREVAHQIVGLSRTVQGERPTIRAIAKNANAALAAQRTEESSE